MSSPNSVKPTSPETNKASTPFKELDNSYDSRESPEDRAPQNPDSTVKKVKKTAKKQVPQQSPEETVKESEDLGNIESVNPEPKDQADKKKKKKKANKNEEVGDDQGSNVTASFPKQSERKELMQNSETNQLESRPSQKDAEKEATAAKPKKAKKKAPEITEDVNEAADVNQEEKSKKAKKKAIEKKEEAPVNKEQTKAETPANNNNTQEKAKTVKKAAVEPVAQKAAKPAEIAVGGAQKTENMRPQSKQVSKSTKNLEVAEPTVAKSALVNALVSPANLTGKGKRNASTAAENEVRYNKNTANTQAREEEERSLSREKKAFTPMGKALENMKKAAMVTEESSAASPKAKLGPIKSKIQTGLSTLRVAPKTADVSTVSFAATTRAAKNVRSPDATQKRAYELGEKKSYADMSGTQKSYVLEKAETQGESKKKNRKENKRMRSFDAGKTEKIKAEDSFETRNKMWQIRKAERLMEEEKKRSRKENEDCTFNPTLISKQTAPLDLSTSTVYDRCVEWTQKVKSAVQAKGESILEEVKKPEPKKPRIKSITGPSDIRTSKVYIEGFTGPQFGVPNTSDVPCYSQEPLKFNTNLEQKISEINDIYENVSAALKKKSMRSGVKEMPRSNYGDAKSASRISVSSQKERVVKMEPVVTNKGDDQRMNTLKQMLNLNPKKEKNAVTVVQAETKKDQAEQNPDYFGGKGDEGERIVPRNGQRVEIRNNRYVIVDDNAEC